MRTSLASWLAGVAGTFVAISLLFLNWRILLLALPPIVYLALAGLRPVPAPVLDVARQASRDRLSVGQEVLVTVRVANRGPRPARGPGGGGGGGASADDARRRPPPGGGGAGEGPAAPPPPVGRADRV